MHTVKNKHLRGTYAQARQPGPCTTLEPCALSVENVVKYFGKPQTSRSFQSWGKTTVEPVHAVEHINVQLAPGEIFGLLGANGSGKSTLIRLISTLLLPDSGTIRVFGHDVAQEPTRVQRMINRVSGEASLFKKRSTLENLIYAARLYNLSVHDARHNVRTILAQLGLSEKRLYEPLEHLSRGMQQKVAIARGLLTTPMLLLLDEPTSGLDPRSKHDVQRFVLEMHARHATTVFLATHDMDEADRLCDRIAIIDNGRIVALDTPQRLKRQVGSRTGSNGSTTMEDVFLALTGRSLDEAVLQAED